LKVSRPPFRETLVVNASPDWGTALTRASSRFRAMPFWQPPIA